MPVASTLAASARELVPSKETAWAVVRMGSATSDSIPTHIIRRGPAERRGIRGRCLVRLHAYEGAQTSRLIFGASCAAAGKLLR